MEKRHFSPDRPAVSLLGFGCMRFPTLPDGGIDAPLARRMIDYAFEHGVNYFDTAYPYHNGQSELVLGEALARFPRDQFFIADKMPTWSVGSPADVDRIFDEQLKKCRVDHFDFYLVHNLCEQFWPICTQQKIYETLLKRKESGQIRRLGFSFHDKPALLRKIILTFPWDFAQIQLNYLDWTLQDAEAQYTALTEAGVPVIVMEPLRGGALARLTPDALDILRANDATASAASWALRYAGSLPNVLTVLSGMSDLEQVRDNVATMTAFRPLDDGERATLDAALAAYRKSGAVPCTACRYCLPCPKGVDIPTMFAIYNQSKVFAGEHNYFALEYNMADASARADRCVQCGVCVPKCPQKIDIPARLAEVVARAARPS